MTARFRTDCGFLNCSSAIPFDSAGDLGGRAVISRFLRPVILVVMLMIGAAPMVAAADGSPDGYPQGAALSVRLQQRRAIRVDGIPLCDLLADLQTESGICLVLDRRIDPSTRVSLTTSLQPTDVLLRQLAATVADCDVSITDDVVYLGPSSSARRLRTLQAVNREAVRKVDRRQYRTALTKRCSPVWEDVTSPRAVLETLFQDAGLPVAQLDRIPHDLWRQGQWPELTLMEAATLLLCQFELTIEILPETNECRIVPVAESVVIERRHAVPRELRGTAQDEIERRFPNLQARYSRAAIRASTTVEEHERIAEVLSGNTMAQPSVTSDSLRTRLLTLSVPGEVSFRQLIAELQASGITIRNQSRVSTQLDTRIEVQLERLPGTEFFPALFRELPVHVEVTDEAVILHDRSAGD